MAVCVHVGLSMNTHACVHKDEHACAYIPVPECSRRVCLYTECLSVYNTVHVNMHMCTYVYTCK